MSENIRVSLLGATGSVGTSTLDILTVASPGGPTFDVVALTANRNVEGLARAALATRADIAVIADPGLYGMLKSLLAGSGVEAAAGADAVVEAAGRPADRVVAAIVGIAGLPSTLAAVRQGAGVALANKESLVCAGALLNEEARRSGARLLPIDSEHNAIFQVLDRPERVEKLILTASGGPFRMTSLHDMAAATPEQACAHPNWMMGAKISVDCATMMNKGLELIEASYLFGVSQDRIEILVHPQSIVHSLVAYDDGSVLAQLGLPDMRTPISYALSWPNRMPLPGLERLDLAKIGRLDFLAPDLERFPALRLARAAVSAGGAAAIALNGANEVAVAAFLQRRIGFLTIAEVVGEVLDDFLAMGLATPDSFEAVYDIDRLARERTIKKLRVAA
ncbi:MAG: 1-deoxy-D-xylulose-5-phosphate reductoisomerase [Alphaproteobacteria bacterium]|nr:1-deoxy-D-xylulose-5-phosphate reductoisomerase [Alphaproteobacteria bacterium]